MPSASCPPATLKEDPDASLEERVVAVVDATIRRYQARRGLLRGIFTYARLHPDWAGEGAQKPIRRMNEHLESYMLKSRAEIRHPRPAAAIRSGLFFISAVCREKILFGDAPYASSTGLTDGQLRWELVRLFMGVLVVQPERKKKRG